MIRLSNVVEPIDVLLILLVVSGVSIEGGRGLVVDSSSRDSGDYAVGDESILGLMIRGEVRLACE